MEARLRGGEGPGKMSARAKRMHGLRALMHEWEQAGYPCPKCGTGCRPYGLWGAASGPLRVDGVHCDVCQKNWCREDVAKELERRAAVLDALEYGEKTSAARILVLPDGTMRAV